MCYSLVGQLSKLARCERYCVGQASGIFWQQQLLVTSMLVGSHRSPTKQNFQLSFVEETGRVLTEDISLSKSCFVNIFIASLSSVNLSSDWINSTNVKPLFEIRIVAMTFYGIQPGFDGSVYRDWRQNIDFE